MKIKTIEIETRFGGVISEAPFENVRPNYCDKIIIDIDEDDNESEIRQRFRNLLQEEQMLEFARLKNKLKAELVKLQYDNIRFTEKDGINYPHVTSILGWDKDFFVSQIDLEQYGSRGHLIHVMIQHFIEKGSWLDLKALADMGHREECVILFKGKLQLKIEDCSHEAFFEQFGNDFTFEKFEFPVFNKEYLYCGRPDAIGTYKGIKSIIDFKTGTWNWLQLAAYAKSDDLKDEGIEQLVICPIGPNDNKSGVKKPTISKNIETEFQYFLKKRAEFNKRFGI